MEGPLDSGITSLKMIQRTMHAEGQWKLKHIHRNCNLTADQLAKLGLSLQTSLHLFEEPPDFVVRFIQQNDPSYLEY